MVEKIHIGTSGWSYKHWKDDFYPKGLKQTEWFSYYTGIFKTTEINTSFYRLPKGTKYGRFLITIFTVMHHKMNYD